MENPLLTIRKEKKITLSDLCLLADVSDTTAHRIERGTAGRVSPAILDCLKELGYDPQQVEADYAAWRKFRTQEILKRA